MRTILALVLVVGCAKDEDKPPPTCVDALANFYGVGCQFADANGTPTSQAAAVNACEQIASMTGDACRYDLDAWRLCLRDDVDSSSQCGACDHAQDVLFQCDGI